MIIDTDPGVDHGPARRAVWNDAGRSADGRLVELALDAGLPAVRATILDRLRGLR